MKLKTLEIEGKVYAEVADGKPIYQDDSGKEVPFDAPHALNKIAQLNREAQSHREAKEGAEAKLKEFADIDDPAAALDAMRKVSSMDDKSLIDAGKVDEIKAAAIKATEEKMAAAIKAKDRELAEAMGERDKLANSLNQELIGGNFARSSWIKENVAIPTEILQSYLQNHFKVEEGKLVAYDQTGQKVWSRSKPGEIAPFDEAAEILIDHLPFKDHILRGRGQNGSGATHPSGSGGGPKTITRAVFDGMGQAERRAKLQDGYKVVDN